MNLKYSSRSALEEFLNKFRDKPGARVLVMGNKVDQITKHLSGYGVCIEISNNAEILDYADGFFDAALVLGMMEHVEFDRWVLQNVHRVLKNDAPLVFSVPNLLRFDLPHVFLSLKNVLSKY